MEKLRCLISDIPQRLLSDIIRGITQQHEHIEIVDCITDRSKLHTIMNEQPIDVLIIGQQHNCFPKFCRDLLDQYSDLLIVSLIDNGRMVAMYLDDVRSDEIIRILRTFGKRSADG